MEQENKAKLRPLKMTDLVDFFAHVGVDAKCQACNDGGFAINVSPNDDGSGKEVRMWMSEAGDITEAGSLKHAGHLYPTVFTICTNCGFVRHFSPVRALKWLAEREKNTKDVE